MLETEGLQMEGQRIRLAGGFLLKRQGVMNRPFIRQMEEDNGEGEKENAE